VPRLSTLIGYKAASDVTAKLAMLAIVVAAARGLAPESFGRFALATTLGWLLGVLTDAGLSLHAAREVARTDPVVPAVVRSILRVRAALAGAAAAVAVPLARGLGGEEAGSFWLLVAAYLVSSLVELLNHVYRGLMRSELESSLNLGQRAATVGLAMLVLWWRPSLGALALAFVLPALATLAASVVLARRLGVFAAKPAARLAAEGSLGPRRLARDAGPIGLGLVLSALYFRLDVFLVDHWLGVDAVAAYNAVFRLVEATRLLPAAVLAVVFPLLCRARTLQPVAVVASGLFVAGLLVAMPAWLAGPWILSTLYGDAYLAAAPTFRVLAAAVPLMFLNYALTHQVLGWHAQRRYAAVCAVALAANLAVNRVMLPAFGIEGAAWATLLTEAVVTGGSVASLLRLEAPSALGARVFPRVAT
jgi:O-antigen/teichoic acid export membrane protein